MMRHIPCGHPFLVNNLVFSSIDEVSAIYIFLMRWVSTKLLYTSWSWVCSNMAPLVVVLLFNFEKWSPFFVLPHNHRRFDRVLSLCCRATIDALRLCSSHGSSESSAGRVCLNAASGVNKPLRVYRWARYQHFASGCDSVHDIVSMSGHLSHYLVVGVLYFTLILHMLCGYPFSAFLLRCVGWTAWTLSSCLYTLDNAWSPHVCEIKAPPSVCPPVHVDGMLLAEVLVMPDKWCLLLCSHCFPDWLCTLLLDRMDVSISTCSLLNCELQSWSLHLWR